MTNLRIDLQPAVTVFGIATDRSFSHRAFAETAELAFALRSASDGSVAESYDVFYEEFNGHKRIAKRSVFVVDTDGTIRYAWSTDDSTVQPDFRQSRKHSNGCRPSTPTTDTDCCNCLPVGRQNGSATHRRGLTANRTKDSRDRTLGSYPRVS